MVRLSWAARLAAMKALEPLDAMIGGWAGRSDISDNVWKINKGADGKQYYLPLQYVVIYLYYRQDLFQQADLQPPKTFDEFLAAAKALTKGDMAGFGMRGGAGGFDNWGPFVLGGGASFEKGGMVGEKALAANRWYVGLARDAKVMPASAPTDSFRQIVDAFKAGRTAMIMHHVGLRQRDRRQRSATRSRPFRCPAPRTGRAGPISATNRTRSSAASKAKEAAFRWISFLSTAENNNELNKLTGQLPITTSGAAQLDGASQALRRCELRLAADRPVAAGSSRRRRTSSPASGPPTCSARLNGRDLARRHDEGHRTALQRLNVIGIREMRSQSGGGTPPPQSGRHS